MKAPLEVDMKHIVLAILIFLSFFLASCRRPVQPADKAPGVAMTLAVEPEAPAVGVATLFIMMTNADGSPINGATIEVRGDMTHAGMEPVLAEATLSQDGVYEAPFE